MKIKKWRHALTFNVVFFLTKRKASKQIKKKSLNKIFKNKKKLKR